jgi:zinc transport system substrate-binding protein
MTIVSSKMLGMRPAPLLALPLTAALLAGCSSEPAGTDTAAAASDETVEQLDVVTALYPYQWVLERVGGDAVAVRNLVPPGAEPHDLELSPQQVAAVSEADLVVYSRGFTPALDEAVTQQAPDRAVDVLDLVEVRAYEDEHAEGEHAEGEHAEDEHAEDEHAGEEKSHGEEDHDHEGEDPHVWLDPARLTTIASSLADALAERSPEQADGFRDRADALAADLQSLDEEYRAGLASCERQDVVVSHDAFGYLTDRYGLRQLAVSGLSPEAEPSPRRLAEVAATARERGVTTIFFEELVSPRVAESLAREVGATAEVLSPLEGGPQEGDYLTAMRANLDALRTALGCA